MAYFLRKSFVFIIAFLLGGYARAQNIITTQALSVASVCPGSTLDVTFSRVGTYGANNVFTVQLSNGGDYANIPTGNASYNSTTGHYTVKATIPSTTPAGTTYTLRVISSSPAVIGTPSVTRLTVKSKPITPTVNAEIVQCQRPAGSLQRFSILPVKLSVATAVPKLYYANGTQVGYNVTSYGLDPTEKSFEIFNGHEVAGEANYRVAQEVDGCESDRVPVKVITKPLPTSGITVDNFVGAGDGAVFGKISYCQNDIALPLNQKGHRPVADGITVSYRKEVGDVEYSGYPPIPNTDKPGTIQFSLMHALNGCQASLRPSAYITVTISGRPSKPTAPSAAVSLCQFQQTSPLSATATESGASLVWYGTNATGGTGVAQATQPSTAVAGTFKYYVAQRINDCEGERTEITVEVKPGSPAPTVVPVSYCQNTQPSPLSAVAASGGTLSWYNSSLVKLAAAPTPSTTNIGQQTFYVSQLVGVGCESQLTPLTVTVNAAPAAPTLARPTYSFCQNAQGEALSATGQNLRWYETATGGTSMGSITPGTASAGTKSYYVSQTVNGCEGARATVTVTVLSVPSAPTLPQANYEFCQGTNATISGTIAPGLQTNWYIYGDEPGLTNTYTSGSTAYATISTTQARTLTYSLFQTAANGCIGPASSQITIQVKPTPAAPTVQAVALCQNAPMPVLQATGQNLLWYSASTGGVGSTTTPTVSTSIANQTTYYVSQSTNGCESPRAALAVVISAIPPVPAVASTGPIYCQNAPAVALAATGQGLKWYRESSAGISLGSTVTPDTKEAGNFTYYVSQTINSCEGGRSSLTVKVNPAPANPTLVSTNTGFCVGTSNPGLRVVSKAGYTLAARYFFRDTSGIVRRDTTAQLAVAKDTVSLAGLIPTTEAGTLLFTLTNQDNSSCSSQPVSFTVAIRSIPVAPVAAALQLCQNEPARTLTAGGSNLLWYTDQTGGVSSPTSPSVTTGQVGQTTYYVSQRLDGCEGPRATLLVTVKALPAPPGVSTKNVCQFSAPESVSATGQSLRWYNPDGTSTSVAPVPVTSQGASLTYAVTQNDGSCESPRATLTVNVLTTPVPMVTRTRIELCQGASAQPLEATGTSLKWIDPAGNVTTSNPTPPTINATTKPEGDVYYVTQTGSNGCESPRVAITVFVQTPPTLSLSGTTTTNLGLEVPVKLTFTGVGPYTYKLSNGAQGTAIKDTTLLILADRTTTYQVAEVSNKCGTGLPGNGSTVTIMVKVPSIQTMALTTSKLCAGASLTTNFMTTGEFNPGSVFKLQFAKVESDTSKVRFIDLLSSQATGGQIVATIPSSTSAGTYWVRVVATNPKIPINGNISPTLLSVQPLATATLTGAQSIYPGDIAKIAIAFTGESPWSFSYRDSSSTGLSNLQTITTSANPHVIEVKPMTSTRYLLTNVNNGCGTGMRLNSQILISISPLLGIEDQQLVDAVDVYPIPTITTLTVRIRGLSSTQPAHLELTDLSGRSLVQQPTRRETSTLDLSAYPSGTYVLKIRVGDRTASKRLVKL